MFILHPAFQKVYVVGDVNAWNAAHPGVGAVEVVRIDPYPSPQVCSSIFVTFTLLGYFSPHNEFAFPLIVTDLVVSFPQFLFLI